MEIRTSRKHESGMFPLVVGSMGIYFSYLLISIFSEKLYNTSYASNAEFDGNGTPIEHRFQNASIIVWTSGLWCAILGQVRAWTSKEVSSPVPYKESLLLGILFALNMLTSNLAQLYISYPTQAIASNIRYLIIVIVGIYFSRVPLADKIPRHKLYVALFITFGVLLFTILKPTSVDQGDHHLVYDQQWKGYSLLFISMLAEALLCDSQAYNKVTYKPSSNQLFKSANCYSFIFGLIYAVWTGTLLESIRFVIQHPQCLKELLLVNILQVIGQLAIYYIITNFKQHVFPLISTTRKIITIVCSIVIFGHTITHLQWLCISMVFAGMILEVFDEIFAKKLIKMQNSLLEQFNSEDYIKTEKIDQKGK